MLSVYILFTFNLVIIQIRVIKCLHLIKIYHINQIIKIELFALEFKNLG